MDVSAQNNTKNVTSNQSGPSANAKAPRPDSLGFGIDPQQLPEKVAEKIQRGANILIALSKDPNLDEMSAAIALAIVLDQQKKHVTAIYSGKTPNALEFLKPEETFEKDTSSLQDFIIALNKSKADHLTYKLDGDYVKIYITPYKGQVKKEDLEYSYGDYNVDLVIVFNVNAGTEIDSALSEYGRIMHDASAINITSGLPGRFADLEWSDPEKSSVCEMVYDLLKELEITELSQEVATALLTGILSATERFSNNRTKPTTMAVASKLMEAGADQQLISANILKPATPATPATPENLATSDTSAILETPTSSDIPTTSEAPTSSNIPTASETPVSSDTPTTTGTPATVDTPTVSDSNNPDTGLKELEELVNQNLAQTTNVQNNQEASSEASQLSNLPSEEPSLSATPLTTGNVMDELARMTASMTGIDQETNNLAGTSDLQTQVTPQTQATPEIQATPQAQPAPEIQTTPEVQPFSQVQPEVQPQTYENPQASMQFQPQAQPQVQMQPQAQAQFETQVQSQLQPQPFPQFQPQQYTQPLPSEQPVSAPSMQSQLPPVNPLPFQSGPGIVGHTISDPVIESGEDMSRLMDEVLAEPSPIQNPVGYQSLVNQGDYINQSLSQQPVPNPQPTPAHPLSVGQQPIVNYIPGQNIATLSAPAMPTMPQNTNYPNPEYTNTIPEYSTPSIPTMPTATNPEPQPTPELQPVPTPAPASMSTPIPGSAPTPAPTSAAPADPMADFIQATPPVTSTPIPDFLQPEAFLPPAPAPVVPAQPTPIQNGYSMQPTVPNMPLPPVAPNGLPTPPIIEPTPEATPIPQIPQAPTIQPTPAPTPQPSPAPQAPAAPVDPSAFRIPGTY